MLTAILWMIPTSGRAQVTETVGTRALGMAGAFVAVADDATATFWNPAGLATGPVFDSVVENQEVDTLDPLRQGVGERSFMIAVGTPSLGLTYYRIRTVAASPGATQPSGQGISAQESGLAKLSTHHFGASLVQSLTTFLTVGTTVKGVRGTAAVGAYPGGSLEDALDSATELEGRTETKMDFDAGVMAVFGPWRVGVAGRNLSEPKFDLADVNNAPNIKLARQVRAGVAYAPRSRPTGTNGPMTIAADIDLKHVETPFGERRELAIGGEHWWWGGRVAARGGIRLNTLRDQFTSQDPVVAVGGSFSPRSGSLVEGQITRGRNELEQGWGISARVTF
jgi:hypothetical protein